LTISLNSASGLAFSLSSSSASTFFTIPLGKTPVGYCGGLPWIISHSSLLVMWASL
jgi:hypothetical protein